MQFTDHCICVMPGSDGTNNHNDPCGIIYETWSNFGLDKTVSTIPCKNHEATYISAGWVCSSASKQESEKTSQLSLPFIDS